jgi:NAD(P)H dehydrogenase (quinone)
MNVLIVSSHPEPKSFTMSLSRATEEELVRLGYEVSRSDLYAMGFNPAAGYGDFKMTVEEPLDLGKQQLAASQCDGFTDDLSREIDKLLSCDLLILHFPVWWYSVPGMLKGWIDRVFAYGHAYGPNGNLEGKRGQIVTTVGCFEERFLDLAGRPVEDCLLHITRGTLEFCGMEAMPPYVIYGVEEKDESGRKRDIETYRQTLRQRFGSPRA